jgi:sulfite reductase (NADPH) hemoprotein beta-component
MAGARAGRALAPDAARALRAAGRHAGAQLLSGLREIATLHGGEFRLTPNQNVIVAGVKTADKARIEAAARRHGLMHDQLPRRCAARPVLRGAADLRLAMAEAERYLPELLGKLESRLAALGLLDEPITPAGDRLSERLRAALPRRDRPGRQGAGALQPVSRRRLRWRAAQPASCARTSTSGDPRDPRAAARRLRDGSARPNERFGDFLHRTGRLDEAARASGAAA